MDEKKKSEERPAPDTDAVRKALEERDREIDEAENSHEEDDED
jgi:hypothetical protein